jgi:hypothetical protein
VAPLSSFKIRMNADMAIFPGYERRHIPNARVF